MRRARRTLIAILVTMVVACSPSPVSPAPSGSPAGSASAPGALATPTPPVTTSPAASIEPATSLAVDDTLLDVLPATVGDVEMTPDPESAAQLIGDPTLGATASRLAVARYTSGDEIVVVSVVRLRPGVFSEGFYDGWRADYDASACQPAGGASGDERVETIGAQQVHVGTCAGGASTYHVHLDGDVLVSSVAVGPGSLGRDVVLGLRP